MEELTEVVRAQRGDGTTTLIEAMINQELGKPFRRDAMRKPVQVAGVLAPDLIPGMA